MILVDRSIKQKLSNGNLNIDPFNSGQLGPASYDIRLSNNFMVFKPELEYIDPLNLDSDSIMDVINIKDYGYFVLHPNQFVLGCSVERIVLSGDLIAQLNGKSSLARLGLQVHATAGFFDPGWDGVATLEFSNVAPIPIRLYPNMLIAQMVFFQGSMFVYNLYGSKILNSKYQNAKTVQGSRYKNG